MSGGEQQRAAIAVALVNDPKVLLADEPTGELDTATAAEVFSALQKANAELGVTVLIVTHDPAVSGVVRRTVAIRDGRTSTETHRQVLRHGQVAQHAVEYAVLDRAGRLQLPREMTEPLGMRGLVRLEAEPDHIGVWPDRREPRTEERCRRSPGDRRACDMLAVEEVTRTFGSGRTATHALRGVSFTVQAGQLVALRGRSGSGKTTLLNIVGGLDLPDSGSVRVADHEVTAMSEHERMRLRRTSVAFIFQSFGLIPILSAAENVGVPLRIAGMPPREREDRVRLMLDIVGLGEHAKQRPASCPAASSSAWRSPGRWRAARRCCWPTSPPASSTPRPRKQIMRLLRAVVQSEGVTALVATHDPNLIDIADSVLELEDGTDQGQFIRALARLVMVATNTAPANTHPSRLRITSVEAGSGRKDRDREAAVWSSSSSSASSPGSCAGISPCILPVLPVVLVAGASTPASGATPPRCRGPAPPPGRWRSSSAWS